jgi:sortase A
MTATTASGKVTRAVGNLFLAVGLLLLGATLAYYGYGFYQQVQSGLQVPGFGLPSLLPRDPPPVMPVPPEMAQPQPQFTPGQPATHIRIPSIEVDAKIVELHVIKDPQGELVWETADHAVGHHVGTAQPGEPSNVVMSGHISSPVRHEGNVFGKLPELKVGETVEVDTTQGTFSYRVVDRKLVEPTEVSVMYPTDHPVLTLITCFPDLIYSHRLVVTAEPTGFSRGS